MQCRVMQCNFPRNRSKSSCIERVSVGLGSKEGWRNARGFRCFAREKNGARATKRKRGCRKSHSSVFLSSLTPRKRFLPRLIKKDNMYSGVTLVTQLITFIKIKKIIQVKRQSSSLVDVEINVCHARIRVTDSGP